jgi:hypothetical protein
MKSMIVMLCLTLAGCSQRPTESKLEYNLCWLSTTAIACESAGSILEAEAAKKVFDAKYTNLVSWIEIRGMNYSHELPYGYHIVKEKK